MNHAMRTLVAVTVMCLAPALSRAQLDSIPAEPDSSAAVMAPASKDNVKRAQFTSDVVDHEPVDQLDSLSVDASRVYFFTEIVDYGGASVAHRWYVDGELVAEVPMKILGPRWRVYSSKNLSTLKPGTITVKVVDARDDVIAERSLVLYRPDRASSTEPH